MGRKEESFKRKEEEMNDSRSFTIAENEYLAEETLITIISGVNHPAFKFISGQFGPLVSGMPCDVPLWLAITLRKRGKCTINMPSWMEVDNLERLVASERTERSLGALPYHFMEIAHILLTNANEDVKQPERVSGLIQDLSNIRMERIRLCISTIAETVKNGSSVVSTSLTNASSMEIFSIKQFFLGSLDAFLWLKPPEDLETFAPRANVNTRRLDTRISSATASATMSRSKNNNANAQVNTGDEGEADRNESSGTGAAPARKLRRFRG